MYRELLPEKTTFLPLLEILARADETVVREQVGPPFGSYLIYNRQLNH